MTNLLELILLLSCIVSLIIALRNNDILTLFYCLGFTTLYVGQYFYHSQSDNYVKVRILHEYGYTQEIAQYILIYLILIFITLSISTYLAGRQRINAVETQNIEYHPTRMSQLYYVAMLFGALFIYGTIIGWESFNDTRPNMNRGGTFGTFLCLSVGLSSCILWCSSRKLSVVNVFIILMALVILILSGARITVMYLILTLALTVAKYKQLKLGVISLIFAIIISIGVLIIGQAVKEFTGGLVKLESLWDSILFTLRVFYNAQTEAFVSTASTLQYQVDQKSIPFNGGIPIMNFYNLLLPSFMKGSFSISMSSFAVYRYSIVPPAGSFFIQGFFFYGVLIHCVCIFLTIWYSNKIKKSARRPGLVVYLFFVQSSCSLILIRGPVDVLPFNLIVVGIMLYFIFNLKRALKLARKTL